MNLFIKVKVALPVLLFAVSATVYANPGKWLIRAAEEGDIERVRELIDSGASVNFRKRAGYPTPLTAAIFKGHTAIAIELLNRGASVDLFGTNYATPLMVAAVRVDLKLVEELIGRGANVNLKAPGENGGTALMWAIATAFGDSVLAWGFPNESLDLMRERRLQIVNLLIANGADVNLTDDNGGSPLLNAVWINNPVIADILLKNGASPAGQTIPQTELDEPDTVETISKRRLEDCRSEDEILKSEKVMSLVGLSAKVDSLAESIETKFETRAELETVYVDSIREGILERGRVKSLSELCLDVIHAGKPQGEAQKLKP